MGRNVLRHASLGLYNHFNTHEAEYHDTIFNHCSDTYIAISICMCVYKYLSCQYPNNANPSIFSSVISCTISYVPVCVCVYSAKCTVGDTRSIGEITLSAIYLEGTTLTN